MNQNQQNIQHYEEDEIDLREVFKTIWKSKVIIIVITTIITLLAVAYALMKTPIYEASAVVEIGNYKNENNSNKIFLDNNNELVKKLQVLFIDMYKGVEKRPARIESINVVKKQKSFFEIKAQGISNELAIKEIQKVLEYVRLEHQTILDDIKKRRELEIKNVNSKISNINKTELILLNNKDKLMKKTLKEYNSELKDINKNIELISKTNPALAAISLTKRAYLLDKLYDMRVGLIDLKNEKDRLKTTKINELIEKRNVLESLLLPYNYKNSEVVGEIITSKSPIKPKKILIVVVAFITGFILSVFLVFFLEFIKNMRQEKREELNS